MVLTGLACWRRRPALAAGAIVTLVPGTIIGLLLLDTIPGRVFLGIAVVASGLATWAWVRARDSAGAASDAANDAANDLE